MSSAYEISLLNLSLAFIPLAIVIFIYTQWVEDWKTLAYASFRMLLQSFLIGYLLNFIFDGSNAYITCVVIVIMVAIAGWIALRPLAQQRQQLYVKSLLALIIGGVPVLALVVFGVVRLSPWFMPRYVIPLAGMIFANCMNSVSLSAERLCSELHHGVEYTKARSAAYRASLLPLTNSFFAVGLVSIPGMMTGQILAGTPPLLAARYQIMVMCMLMGAAGIASAWFLKNVEFDIINNSRT